MRCSFSPLLNESRDPGNGVLVVHEGAERVLEVGERSEVEELPEDFVRRHRWILRRDEEKKMRKSLEERDATRKSRASQDRVPRRILNELGYSLLSLLSPPANVDSPPATC